MPARNAPAASAIAALLALSGAAFAQGQGAPGSVTVSGLLHTPLGQATLGTPNGRRLQVSNLGSSGQDGVSIQASTLGGLGATVELKSLFTGPAGPTFRTRYKGWDGTIKGRMAMTASGNSSCTCTVDFSTIAATGVRWTWRRHDGSFGKGISNGPALAFTIIDPLAAVGSAWSFEATRRSGAFVASEFEYKEMSLRPFSPAIINGLGPIPVDGIDALEFAPIICITDPCPGQWGNVSSLDLTASGMPIVEVSNAALESFSWGVSNPSSVGPGRGGYSAGRLLIWGGEGCTIGEVCDDGGSTCDRDARKVRIDGPSNPRASIDLDPDELVIPPNHLNPSVLGYRALSVKAEPTGGWIYGGGGGGGGGSGGCGLTFKQKANTILQFQVRPSAGGALDITADASGQGATALKYTMFLPSGTPVRSTVSLSLHTIHVSGCGSQTPVVSVDGRAGGKIRFGDIQSCPQGAAVTLDGVTTTGVGYMTCEPVDHTVTITAVDHCDIDALDGAPSITIDDVTVVTPAFCGGVPVTGTPGVTFTLHDTITNIEQLECKMSGPSDWVKMSFDKGGLRPISGGGVGVDLTPLLTPPPNGGVNAFTFDGVDDDETPNCTVKFTAGATARTILTTYEDHDPNVTGVEWTITDANGAVLAAGISPPTIVSCIIDGDSPDLGARVVMAGATSLVGSGHSSIIFSTPVTVTPPGGGSPVAFGKAINTKPLTGTARSVAACRVSAAGLDTFTLTEAFELMFDGYESGGPRIAAVQGVGSGLLRWKAPELNSHSDLLVSNIGSSGNDGVRIEPFLGGALPSQNDLFRVKVRFPTLNETVAVDFRSRCPECDPWHGHFTVTPTAGGTACLYTADATGTGPPAALTMRAYDQNGAQLGQFTLSPTDSFSIPRCSEELPAFGIGGDGVMYLQLPGIGNACYDLTVQGATLHNVRTVTFQPNDPSIPPSSLFEDCTITGANLDNFELLGAEIGPACPADLGKQGGSPGSDGLYDNNDFVVFITFFFTADHRADLGVQGGLPGRDDHFDNNDFVVFIDDFFHGCP